MTWTRISDDFCDRPDLLECSRSARLLYVELLVYSNRLGLDGRIPRAQLHRLTDDPDALDELVDAGLVTSPQYKPGLLEVDWTDQEPAERVKLRQQRNAERQSKYRDRQERHKSGDHSTCSPQYCPSRRNGVTNSATNGVSNSAPTLTVPSRQGQGQGEDGEASANAHACLQCGISAGKHAFDCELTS